MVTSGYVNCIPIITLSNREKATLEQIAKDVISEKISQNTGVMKVDELIFCKNLLSEDTIRKIVEFGNNLQCSV